MRHLAQIVLIPHKRDRTAKDHPMTIEAPDTQIVTTYRVACDGGEGALGHPRVWLLIPSEQGWVECPYCDCRYVHEDFVDTGA